MMTASRAPSLEPIMTLPAGIRTNAMPTLFAYAAWSNSCACDRSTTPMIDLTIQRLLNSPAYVLGGKDLSSLRQTRT